MRYELRDAQDQVVNTIVLQDEIQWPIPDGCTLHAIDDLPLATTGNLSRLEFLRRFTVAERVAIRKASETDPVIYDFLDLLYQAQEVRVDDPDTIAGLQYLEMQGLLAQGRSTEILISNGA